MHEAITEPEERCELDGGSDVDLARLKAEDAVFELALPEYQRGMSTFFGELVHLNLNIYFIERILEFPSNLFCERDDAFLPLVVRNFVDVSLLIITRIVADKSKRSFTLTQFRNRLLNEFLRREFRKSLQLRLKETRFEMQTKRLINKAVQIRNALVAHLTEDVVRGDLEVERLYLADLKEMRDALNSLLGALALGTEYFLLPLNYHPSVENPKGFRNDIERLLDSIARESPFFNYPERRAETWKFRRARLSEKDIEALNHYRRKLGLPEA
jgi:hypothetical protein